MSAAEGACHGTTHESLEWTEDPRGEAKTQLLKYSRENPSGAPVIAAVRAIVNPDAEAGDADHQLALRFYREYSELFKTSRRGDLLWVEPTIEAFHLTASKHSSKHGDCEGVALSNARKLLGRRRMVASDSTRGALLGALAAKRDATDDEFVVFRDRQSPSNHLLIPFSTRFNSLRRVREARRRFVNAWQTAATRADRGVVLTLTTDPGRFDSIEAATETLMDDVNRMKGWIANRYGDGSRPECVVVPEFTESGLPHLHVTFFGMGFVPHEALSHYWSERRDRGKVVWCDGIVSRGGRWLWSGMHPDRAGGCSPRGYLGKTFSDLEALAAADSECVHAVADQLRAGDDGVDASASEWWKLACYWATETKLFTASPSLRSDAREGSKVDAGGDDDGPRWEFKGVARYGDLPAHVTRKATLIRRKRRRPPPDVQFRSYRTVDESEL